MPPQRPKRLPTDFFDRLLSNQTDDQINDLLNSLVDEQISPTVEPAEDLMPLVRDKPPAAPVNPKRSGRGKLEDAIVTRDEELEDTPVAPPSGGLDELIPRTSRMQGKSQPAAPVEEPGAGLETPLPTPAIPTPLGITEEDLAMLAGAEPAAPEVAWPEMPLPPEAPALPEVPPPPGWGATAAAPEPITTAPKPPVSEPARTPSVSAAVARPPAPPEETSPRPEPVTVAPSRSTREEIIRRKVAGRWEHPKRKPKLPKLAKAVAPVAYPPLKKDVVDQYLDKLRLERKPFHLSKIQRAGLMFLLPAFIAFSLFSWYPMIKGLMLSFVDYHPTGVSSFIGFENYLRAFQDAMFWRTLMHAGVFCLLALGLGFWLPIVLAIYINELKFGKGFLKFAFFLPFLMPTVPAAILWKWMLDQGYGLVNAVISGLGLAQPHVGWLTDPNLALLSIVLLYLWKNTGWALLIYSAGLGNIDETFYEEAEIDGASIWDKVTKITLPSLRGVIGVMLIITIINTLQLFTEVYIMTSGGPMNATEMIATYIYKQAFFYMDIGYASALSMLLLLMLLGITLIRLRRMEPEGA